MELSPQKQGKVYPKALNTTAVDDLPQEKPIRRARGAGEEGDGRKRCAHLVPTTLASKAAPMRGSVECWRGEKTPAAFPSDPADRAQVEAKKGDFVTGSVQESGEGFGSFEISPSNKDGGKGAPRPLCATALTRTKPDSVLMRRHFYGNPEQKNAKNVCSDLTAAPYGNAQGARGVRNYLSGG